VLTQRIIRAPFDLTWPSLVPDVHFDLDRHISRVALPSPGTADQFDVLISEFLSRPLVRTRPLWQLVIVEGLEDGRVAAALKVHHALADGVSGAKPSPVSSTFRPGTRTAPKVDDASSEPVAVEFDVVRARRSSSIARRAGARRERRDVVADRVFDVVRTVVRVALSRGRKRTTPNQPSIFEARRTSFNGRAGVEKVYHRMRIPLADAKRAAKYHGPRSLISLWRR